ncbi:MAG: toxin-antitoxin system protein [Selenomonadales bacterium]|nr:toxin-antitoxin system protein [Clostridiales bacterium]PWL96177.1 MAG: toxin-antitoxin system protein [Selenomonadales bacterium]
MRTLKQKISVSLDEDIITKIKELSELDDRPLSQYINIVLKKYIKQYDQNHIYNPKK